MKKIALVLSGGGFKGAFQLGALEFLRENWRKIDPESDTMKFNVVAGISVGSLNGLLVAADKFKELESLWNDVAKNGVTEIYTSDFIDTTNDPGNPDPQVKMSLSWDSVKKRFPNTTKNLLWRLLFRRNLLADNFKKEFTDFRAIADNSPLKNKLLRLAKKSEIKDCTYICGYVSLDDGVYYSAKHSDFTTDTDFANGVLASTTMPIIWNPVEQINSIAGHQKYLVDGGVRNVSPLGDVIREINRDNTPGEYTIIIINCSSGQIPADDYKNKNIAQIALRSLDDIAITEIFNNDIEEFIDKNYIIEQINSKHPGETVYDYDFANNKKGNPLKHFNAIIIQPSGEVLGDTILANDVLIERRILHGRQKAEEALNKFTGNTAKLKFTIV